MSVKEKMMEFQNLHIVMITLDSGEDDQQIPKLLVESFPESGTITPAPSGTWMVCIFTWVKGHLRDRDPVNPPYQKT